MQCFLCEGSRYYAVTFQESGRESPASLLIVAVEDNTEITMLFPEDMTTAITAVDGTEVEGGDELQVRRCVFLVWSAIVLCCFSAGFGQV